MSVEKSCRDIGEPKPGYTDLNEVSEIPVADSTHKVRYKAYVCRGTGERAPLVLRGGLVLNPETLLAFYTSAQQQSRPRIQLHGYRKTNTMTSRC